MKPINGFMVCHDVATYEEKCTLWKALNVVDFFIILSLNDGFLALIFFDMKINFIVVLIEPYYLIPYFIISC
jgi:hypothetical protein